MKKTISVVVLMLITICLHASSVAKLHVTGFDVQLIVGKSFSYEYDKKSDGLKEIHESVSNGEFKIEAKYNSKNYLNSGDRKRCKLTIYIPQVESITMINSNLKCDDLVKSNNLKLDLSGLSSANLNADAKNITFEVLGSSRLEVVGKAQDKLLGNVSGSSKVVMRITASQATVSASGSSNLDLSGVISKNVKCNLSNLSKAKLNMDASDVDLRVSGSSNASYTSNKASSSLSCHVSGDSGVDIDLEVNIAKIDASNSSKVMLNLKSDDVQVNTGGSARVELKGSANNLKSKATSSSVIDASTLEVVSTDVVTTGTGSVNLNEHKSE